MFSRMTKLITSGRFSVKSKLILIISFILVSGLTASNYFNYKALEKLVRDNLINNVLPLARDKIYSELINYSNLTADALTMSIKKSNLPSLLKSYKDVYGCNVYLVSYNGIVQVHPNEKLTEQADIYKLKGLKDIAGKILSSKQEPAIYEFRRNREHVLLSVRHIPRLNMFLFVEIDENSMMNIIMKTITVNLIFGLFTALAVIIISVFFINHYQNQLEYMAVTDALTGANNRREFDIQFRKAVYNFNRNGFPFSIIIFDIDHFKYINDTMGHIMGDTSIKKIASIAQSGMRLTDVLVRWGGDEFIIISHGDVDSAVFVAERIRKQVEKNNFFDKYEQNSSQYDLTISCGVSGFRKDDTLDSILARADSALYRAKSEGRNRVVKE